MTQFEHRKLGNGYVTIAYDFDTTGKRIDYALAFCSPKDRFSKAKGRLITSRRLEVYRTNTRRATSLEQRAICSRLELENTILSPSKQQIVDRIFESVTTSTHYVDDIKWLHEHMEASKRE